MKINVLLPKSLLVVVIFALLPLFVSTASGALITYNFAGTFSDSNSLFNAGDTFSGSYTFESTVVGGSHPDPSFTVQAVAIDGSLPGTGWNLTVFSSAIPDFSVSGSIGVISAGNNTSFGDRYSATLFGSGPLPGGLTLNFFQLDLQDSIANGADMLSNADFQTLPDLSLAAVASGRFFTGAGSGGCEQCFITITSFNSLSSIPEPPALIFVAVGLACLVFLESNRARFRRK